MEVQLNLDESKLPSIIQDPFSQNKIVRIMMVFNCKYGSTNIYSIIEFENGNTKGEQTIKADSMDELYRRTSEFIKNLK